MSKPIPAAKRSLPSSVEEKDSDQSLDEILAELTHPGGEIGGCAPISESSMLPLNQLPYGYLINALIPGLTTLQAEWLKWAERTTSSLLSANPFFNGTFGQRPDIAPKEDKDKK